MKDKINAHSYENLMNTAMIKMQFLLGAAADQYRRVGRVPTIKWMAKYGGSMFTQSFESDNQCHQYIEDFRKRYDGNWSFKRLQQPRKRRKQQGKVLRAYLFPIDMPRNTPDDQILRLWNNPTEDTVRSCTPDELAASLNDDYIGFTEYWLRFIYA